MYFWTRFSSTLWIRKKKNAIKWRSNSTVDLSSYKNFGNEEAYGEEKLSQENVTFREGRKFVGDDDRSTTSRQDNNIAAAAELMKNDRRITRDRISEELKYRKLWFYVTRNFFHIRQQCVGSFGGDCTVAQEQIVNIRSSIQFTWLVTSGHLLFLKSKSRLEGQKFGKNFRNWK
jgi:hypothetical protein